MTSIIYIGNRLSKKGKTQTSIETLGRSLENEGFKVISASSRSNKLMRLMDMVLTVIRNASTTDFVLIDTYSTWNFYYAYIISRLCNIMGLKYIPILRGGDLPSRLEKSKGMSDAIFVNAFKNIGPSEYLHSVFGSRYKNVITIPNSIDLNDYPYHKKTFDIPKLLWVRSFSQIYNPEMALQVVKKLKDLGLQYQLCMVGPEVDGSLQKTKTMAKDLNIDVKFTGKLEKEEWRDLSEDYNIFINTTNFDNTPVSVIEAMALGLPVISTNVGGLPYLIDDGVDGFLVDPNDVDRMVETIVSILDKGEMAIAMAQKARVKAEGFDWNNVKLKWLNLLKL